ncbi:HNH endonuclease [Archangium gephyra]|uniref:HNH endonuclease n=1 Tax=Archangium gephyra TaxID=48 RepID=UPI0035D44DE6
MSGPKDAIALAEKVLTLLAEGSFSATYKYALFIALLDLCLEQTSKRGAPPSVLTTRQLAEKTIELYWPHAIPFEGQAVLRQGGTHQGSQAEILRAIAGFRGRHAGSSTELIFRARSRDEKGFEALVRLVEWKLIEMPIPRLQVLGGEEERFLYEYAWTRDIQRSEVSAYQRRERSTFDNRLLLRPRVAQWFVQLNGVLRPLIQREWARMVAAMNGLPELRLEEFLFGASRISLEAVRSPLRELQSGRCFYCDGQLGERSEVDHFIPWSRHPDNGLDNLVVAHDRCNNAKRDFLAAAEHVERWAQRSRSLAGDLEDISQQRDWARDARKTLGVARAMYVRLPEDARLWQREKTFEQAHKERIVEALAA